MQYLKCAELACMVILPNAHKLLRKTYDIIGVLLARLLVHAILADVAYILLKPFEWCGRVILKMLIPNIDEVSSHVYLDS
jgi:hypothetical protein